MTMFLSASVAMGGCTTCGAKRFTDAALEDCISESGQHSFEEQERSAEYHKGVAAQPVAEGGA